MLELLSIICCSVETHVTVEHAIPPINAMSPMGFDPGTSRIVSHALPTFLKKRDQKQRINPNILCRLRIINEPGFGYTYTYYLLLFSLEKKQKENQP